MFGTRHVDLEPQHVRAVGELAGAHPAEEVEVLGDAAVAVRAVRARLGQRAARRAHLLGRLAVDVREPVLDEPLGERVELVVVVGRVSSDARPSRSPSQRTASAIESSNSTSSLSGIGVVEAQVAGAAVLGGEAEVEEIDFACP